MNEEVYTTISLKDVACLFLRKIWIIVGAAVFCGAVAFGGSKLLLSPQYSSHISMYVQSYTNVSEDTLNNQNNISNSKQLINTYIEVLKDDAVMRAVGAQLAEEFEVGVLSECFSMNGDLIVPASLKSCISITSVNDTSALTVTTTAKNAEVAAAICNILADVSPEFIKDAVGVGSISTIDTARVYENPIAPNHVKNTALGLMVGMVLAMAVIFLIDFFDNTVKDTDMLAQRFDKAIIGEVHSMNDNKKRSKEKGEEQEKHIRLTDDKVPFFVVESYKSIRTNITFALSTYEKKILAISSANPNEGKSTTAANIAIAAAQGGSRVLLIDADMRKSVQHKIFGLKNKKGLSSVISKQNKTEECIQRSVMQHLDVMTAGPTPPNPSELLSSEAAKSLFKELSAKYALIVVDLPPVRVVSDAMTISRDVSGMIMVVRYGKTTFDDLEDAKKRTELAQMNLLGYVLNDIENKSSALGYYRKKKYDYGYGYTSYGYGAEPTEEKAKS